MFKYLVWDVARARPVAEALSYAQALLVSDANEARFNRSFIVMEA